MGTRTGRDGAAGIRRCGSPWAISGKQRFVERCGSYVALVWLLLAGSAVCAASSFTYAYEGEDGTRFLWHRDRLMGPTETLIPLDQMEYYQAEASSCGITVFSGSTTWDPFGDVDSVVIEGANTLMLPDGALSRIGAAENLPISWSNRGRFAIYRYEPGYEFEYYFKDSTGQRIFRFTTAQMLLKDFSVPESALAGCVFSPGNACVGAQLDMNVAGTDAVSFGNAGLDAAYFFPQFAFSTVGTHYTTGGLTSGVLTVRLVRKSQTGPGPQPGPDPGDDTEPVPEPSTWLLGATGATVMLLRRTSRNARASARKENSL